MAAVPSSRRRFCFAELQPALEEQGFGEAPKGMDMIQPVLANFFQILHLGFRSPEMQKLPAESRKYLAFSFSFKVFKNLYLVHFIGLIIRIISVRLSKFDIPKQKNSNGGSYVHSV